MNAMFCPCFYGHLNKLCEFKSSERLREKPNMRWVDLRKPFCSYWDVIKRFGNLVLVWSLTIEEFISKMTCHINLLENAPKKKKKTYVYMYVLWAKQKQKQEKSS